MIRMENKKKRKGKWDITFITINVMKANEIKACSSCECAQSLTVSGGVQFLYQSEQVLISWMYVEA